MATTPLTPEQQAALDAFVTDAQAAEEAHKEKQQADTNLAAAQLAQQTTTATDITDHQAALAAAQKFIDLMVPTGTPTTPAAATSSKKGG